MNYTDEVFITMKPKCYLLCAEKCMRSRIIFLHIHTNPCIEFMDALYPGFLNEKFRKRFLANPINSLNIEGFRTMPEVYASRVCFDRVIRVTLRIYRNDI